MKERRHWKETQIWGDTQQMSESQSQGESHARRMLRDLAEYGIPDEVDLWPAIRARLVSLRGEHNETKQSRSSEKEIASQKTLAMTRPVSLRGAHDERKQSRSSEKEIASQKTLAMTRPVSLRGEHDETKQSRSSEKEIASQKTIAMTRPVSLHGWIVSLRGAHFETKQSRSSEKENASQKTLATTRPVSLRGAHDETKQSRSSEKEIASHRTLAMTPEQKTLTMTRPESLRGAFCASGAGDVTKQSRNLLRVAVATIGVFVLLTAVLLATPQGRAWARNALLFFTRRDSSILTIPTQAPASLVEVIPVDTPMSWPTATPNPASLQPFHETCGSIPYPRCNLEQIKGTVGFPVKNLIWLPEGMEFTGATGGPQMVILMYQGERGTLYLAQSLAETDDNQEWEIAADTQVEAVSIGSSPGEYVQGGWGGLGIEKPGEIGWEQDSGKQTLRWEQDGIRYSMWFYAHKTGNGHLLDKDSMVQLALQLQADTSIAPRQATSGADEQSPYLTLEQAAVRAGFPPKEPAWLPDGYLLAGATYSPEKNAVCLYYRYRLEAAAPTLTLFESHGWLPSVDEIKIKQLFNGKPIDIPTSIQSMEVGGSENGLATWASNGVNLSPICGGMEIATNKALLWRANGMNFVLGAMVDQFQGRGFLSNIEMRRVAESLTGIASFPAEALDPERLTSMSTLKSKAGFPVKTPTRMLVDMHFDHAVYHASGSTDNPFRGTSEGEEALLIYLSNPVGDGSDGRFFNLFIAQASGAGIQTLEETAMGGGYEYLNVNGQPALHRTDCWDDSETGGFAACMQILAWFENGIRYDIEAFLDKALPEEMLVAIGESMK